jgi:small membrane protein
MIIQLILSFGLLSALCYAFLQRRKSRLISYSLMLVSLAGILAVLMPDATSTIASLVGVGRGADLILYCWIVITLLVSINLQFKILQVHELLTVLTRELALRAPITSDTDAGRLGGHGR